MNEDDIGAVDLHVHTTASDGALTPSEVVAVAAEAGLRTLAITDHDTLGGLPEGLEAAEAHGIELVCGVEISIRRKGGRLHMLAYLPRPDVEPLASVVATMAAAREKRARRILDNLATQGVHVTFEEVRARANGALGRPHIAAVLVDRGFVGSRQEAFDRYLADDCPAAEPVDSLDALQAVRLIAESGGAAVVAHPWTLALPRPLLREELGAWRAAGLVGVEVYRPDHDDDQRAVLLELADELGLVATGGSDFHRLEAAAIGGLGTVPLPDGVLAALGIAPVGRA